MQHWGAVCSWLQGAWVIAKDMPLLEWKLIFNFKWGVHDTQVPYSIGMGHTPVAGPILSGLMLTNFQTDGLVEVWQQ